MHARWIASRLRREPLAAWPSRLLALWPARRAPAPADLPAAAWPLGRHVACPAPDVFAARPGDLRGTWEPLRGQRAAWTATQGGRAPFPTLPPANAHEAAFRLVAAVFAGRPGAEVHDLAERVATRRSTGTSARNHAVGERAALALAAVVLATSLRARAYRDAALELPALLTTEVADGTGAEQAWGYLLQDLEWGLLAWALGVPGLEGALLRGAEAAAAHLAHDGSGPDYGDDDGGRVFPTASSDRDRVGAVLQALRAPVPDGYVPGALAAWLGLPDVVGTRVLAPWTGRSSTVLRRGEAVLVLRHGPLGAPPLRAHGHADALGVWWAPRGSWVIGGRGTGPYQGDAHDRRFRRGSQAVATVTVDGRDHAIPHDHPFLWRATTDALRVEVHEHAVTARIEAHGHALIRTVSLCDDGSVTIRDEVRGEGRHCVALGFPLRPGARAVLIPDPHLAVRDRADTHAGRYGEARTATTLVAEAVLALPVVLHTRIAAVD